MAELSQAALDELVEEAIVDAYGEDEQLTGFYTMIEENLALPFPTRVLGVEPPGAGIHLTDCGTRRIALPRQHPHAIPIPHPPPPPPPPPPAPSTPPHHHPLPRPC